jgi:hypothetical protein
MYYSSSTVLSTAPTVQPEVKSTLHTPQLFTSSPSNYSPVYEGGGGFIGCPEIGNVLGRETRLFDCAISPNEDDVVPAAVPFWNECGMYPVENL